MILTGQHPALNPASYGLDDCPLLRLNCAGLPDPHQHVREVTAAILQGLTALPDMLVVQGDTSSALGGALAGFAAGVPVAHIEAGLRSHDPAMPWPEEEFRIAIDAQADLLFAPTELAAANLRREHVSGEISVTGNTGIDALLKTLESVKLPNRRRSAVPQVLVTCHRRESWGSGLRSVAEAVCQLAAAEVAEFTVLHHPNQFVSDSMQTELRRRRGIRLEPQCGYRELLLLMHRSDLILSDSGGIQEEAPAMGIPLLVLRDKTERPEGITTGNLKLVGTRTEAIVEATTQLLGDPAALGAMSRAALPYGDGHAAPRIAASIERWLHSRPSAARA